MGPNLQKRVFFATFEFATDTEELFSAGEPVKLQPIPAAILAMLLERQGELITREEIINRIWPDSTVEFDQRISSSIKQIRQVLNDDSAQPRFIKTVPRRGYRFVAPLSKQPTDFGVEGHIEGRNGDVGLKGHGLGRWAAATVAFALIIIPITQPRALFSIFKNDASIETVTAPTILILPSQATDEYDQKLAASLTNKMALAFTGVNSETLVTIYGDPPLAANDNVAKQMQMAEQMNADYLMNSVIERENGQREVLVKVIEVNNQESVSTYSFHLPFKERRGVSQVAADQIVDAVLLQLTE